MTAVKKTYVINNLFARLYTITLYFKKGVNTVSFLENLKKIIKENDVNWDQNTFSFMSKESHSDLNSKYTVIFNEIKDSGNWDGFLNYKLSFKNFFDAVTIFTIIESYVSNDLDLFMEELKNRINAIIKNISPSLKFTFGIKDKSYNILSYALINDQKLLITINTNLYNILNVAFAENKKMFDMSKRERNIRLSKDRFLHSYLFSFTFNNKEYLFKEFLNTCKVCKNYHADFQKKKCIPVCVQCGTIKETVHVCNQKSVVCALCKIYLNKDLKHIPLTNACEHKKNIHVAMFINTRQKTLLKIFQKKIKTVNNTSSFNISNEDFPILK
ncbi:hypothetical protein Yalta_037 [Yalta virus]|nr:hypothetical protein Yalta_037 [Yalta virus]